MEHVAVQYNMGESRQFGVKMQIYRSAEVALCRSQQVGISKPADRSGKSTPWAAMDAVLYWRDEPPRAPQILSVPATIERIVQVRRDDGGRAPHASGCRVVIVCKTRLGLVADADQSGLGELFNLGTERSGQFGRSVG